MILRSAITWLARVAAVLYFRVRYIGDPVPPEGSALLVANHPNSLLDPVLVMAAARRPVRFLAKAPLFDDPLTAWFVRLGGAVPVHRREDAAEGTVSNHAMFESVQAALVSGEVIGLFPEGISHSGASLVPLKTGAARIALGAAPGCGGAFPIIPIGLVFRQKETFRSPALVVRGEPVPWDDLQYRGPDDGEAVRLLTERIASALRRQTLNLQTWHDRPAVETAVRIWEAGQPSSPIAGERVARLALATRVLADARRAGDPLVGRLVADLDSHAQRLARLRLRPGDLGADVSAAIGVSWAFRVMPILLPLSAVVGIAGWLAFLIPYHLTGLVIRRLTLAEDVRSTWKALLGSCLYLGWLGALAIVVWRTWGWAPAVMVLLLLPVIGMAGLLVRERWRGAWLDARRFLLLRSRRSLVESLTSRQRQLAERLDELLHRYPDSEAT